MYVHSDVELAYLDSCFNAIANFSFFLPFSVALSTRKKKHPRNTIKSKILKTRKRKRDYDEGIAKDNGLHVNIYKDYLNQPDLPYDEDKKGGGQHKCYACDIYFINDDAKKQHEKTKKHKRRVKILNKETPYTYVKLVKKDALKAAEISL
ncbi:hypothetical protein C922_00139 [Plasmodium inui San Antonio 1]|uniref:C2H2-type domain-containing protein n=1 Tax=Plasmodium inui San Antonio 1 TaxID=1237626 RepID=W7AV41_9APIC|nr:hypothetical protein C922_00139 [Plasmodium inui San Antonio 1]EUD69276.1 hypothetical protein C922_00139 [Plasmodium inui San Antonio 1]